ncbi:MAG TPA: nitrate- and nitrite sensing domain-containing protein, partial [Mycobacteriales bacterium]
MFARLRVRQKLALLVLPLLVLIVVGAVPIVGGRFAAAASSTRTADAIQRAVRIGELVQELQQERLVSLGYVALRLNRDRLVARSARVLDLSEQLAVDYGAGDDALSSVLRGVGYRAGLGGLRDQVLRREIGGLAVWTAYTDSIKSLIDLLGLNSDADLSSPVGRQEFALDAIIRHDESTSAAASALFVAPGFKVTPQVVALVNGALSNEDREERVFTPLADPVTVGLYEQVKEGPSRQSVEMYLDLIAESPGDSLTATVPQSLLPKAESLISLGRLVETRIAAQAVQSATASARRDRLVAGFGVGLALVVLLAAVILSVLISRSIARPLRRLTESADAVAEAAKAELVRVADTEDAQAAAPRLQPVRVGTSDELGELAEAFNRVQRVAADLVERQVVGRRNVATMFGNVGRRTQNLVGRQLAMIDSLERNEQDPVLLERLYRLDHVSTRLRRNANSLVVLSGAADEELSGEPLSVADTIRAALGEIEGFQRVRLVDAEPALLTPYITPDVILLLAELLENGTSFSPPHTEVEVGGGVLAGGDVRIRIVDHGLGMSPEQIAEENARLVERERLDLAPTDVLGLFVVGRLSRRHGIRVTLLPTTGTGVTAEVIIPGRYVVRADEAPVAVPAGAQGVMEVHGGVRGWWEPAAPAAEPAAPVDPSAPARSGPGIVRRRVRGAQHPRTDPRPPVDPAGGPPPVPPEEARQVIEDFESGVRRATEESSGEPRHNGYGSDGEATPLFLPPVPPEETRAAVEEFEEGLRRALARLDEVAPAPAHRNGHTPTLFSTTQAPTEPAATDAPGDAAADAPAGAPGGAVATDAPGDVDLPAAWTRADGPATADTDEGPSALPPRRRADPTPPADPTLAFFQPEPAPPTPDPAAEHPTRHPFELDSATAPAS